MPASGFTFAMACSFTNMTSRASLRQGQAQATGSLTPVLEGGGEPKHLWERAWLSRLAWDCTVGRWEVSKCSALPGRKAEADLRAAGTGGAARGIESAGWGREWVEVWPSICTRPQVTLLLSGKPASCACCAEGGAACSESCANRAPQWAPCSSS